MDGTKDPKQTIKAGYNFIKKNKGIDLIILSIGPEYDPHIAYNTSGKSNINSKMRVVDLPPETFQGKSHKGITIGIKDLLETKKALLIAYGKDKARSLSLAFNRKVNVNKVPASALLLHKNLIVVIDKDAGKFLIHLTHPKMSFRVK